MSIRIIDNKRIDLTETEFQLYNEIVQAHTQPNFKGENIFKGLFESDDKGIIIFLRAPEKFLVLEAFLFMVAVMNHQYLRLQTGKVDFMLNEVRELMDTNKSLIEELRTLKEELILIKEKNAN